MQTALKQLEGPGVAALLCNTENFVNRLRIGDNENAACFSYARNQMQGSLRSGNNAGLVLASEVACGRVRRCDSASAVGVWQNVRVTNRQSEPASSEGLPSAPRRMSEASWLALLFFAAFAIRFAYVLTDLVLPEINDMGVYAQLGAGLYSGEGYHSDLEPHFTSLRAPGFPYFISAVYSCFGKSAFAVLAVQALMGAATCSIVGLIGRDLAGPATGLIAGALCAINPEALHWTREFLTETLFTFLLALVVYGSIQLSKSRSGVWLVVVGVALGYATLVRANALAFIPFVLVYITCFADQPMRWRVSACTALLVLAAAVLTPWTIRNYRIHGVIVPVSTIGGLALYVSLPPENENLKDVPLPLALEQGRHEMPNGYVLAWELFGHPPRQTFPEDFNEVEESARGREIYLRYAMEDPLGFAELVAVKASLIFNPLPRKFHRIHDADYGLGAYNVLVRYTSAIFFFGLFIFGALGLIEKSSTRGPVVLLFGLLVYQVSFLLVFRPALRYLLPGLVICSVFSAHGILTAARLRSWVTEQENGGRWKLAAWVFVSLLLTLNAYYHVFVLRGAETAKSIAMISRLLGLG